MRTKKEITAQQIPDQSVREHVARLIEQNRQQVERDYPRGRFEKSSRLGIVGAGAMGAHIAAVALSSELSVTLVDKDPEAVRLAPQRVAAAFPKTVDRERSLHQLRCSSELAALAETELIIESVPEKPDIKHSVLAALEQAVPDRVILATNTSTIPIGRLATALTNPGRFGGLHFFMPLADEPVFDDRVLEVIPGPQATDEAIACILGFCQRVQHTPLVVRDGPGFVANRLLMTYMNAGMALLLSGVALPEIERAARDFGMALGPLQVYDEVGLDVAFHCGWTMEGMSDLYMVRSPVLVKMVKSGYLGRKTGAGFFTYDDPPPADGSYPQNPEAGALIQRWAAPPRTVDRQTLTAELVLPMVLEATRLIEEGRAEGPGQIDLAVMFGLGFPRRRGGLLYWTDGQGAARIVQTLARLAEREPRLKPTPLLLQMAADNQHFYPTDAAGRDGSA